MGGSIDRCIETLTYLSVHTRTHAGTDNVNVTVLNSAYMTAVARKRSESNMVRAGAFPR